MAPSTTSKVKSSSAKSAKKTKSRGTRGKKLTHFNKFMQTELARLKEVQPDISHQERFKLATSNWKLQKEKKDKSG